jgi:hypothetical protein
LKAFSPFSKNCFCHPSELVGSDVEFVADLGDREAVEEVSLQDGDLVCGAEIASFSSCHVSLRGVDPSIIRALYGKLHFQLRR